MKETVLHIKDLHLSTEWADPYSMCCRFFDLRDAKHAASSGVLIQPLSLFSKCRVLSLSTSGVNGELTICFLTCLNKPKITNNKTEATAGNRVQTWFHRRKKLLTQSYVLCLTWHSPNLTNNLERHQGCICKKHMTPIEWPPSHFPTNFTVVCPISISWDESDMNSRPYSVVLALIQRNACKWCLHNPK